jgi:hypothetical protein
MAGVVGAHAGVAITERGGDLAVVGSGHALDIGGRKRADSLLSGCDPILSKSDLIGLLRISDHRAFG